MINVSGVERVRLELVTISALATATAEASTRLPATLKSEEFQSLLKQLETNAREALQDVTTVLSTHDG